MTHADAVKYYFEATKAPKAVQPMIVAGFAKAKLTPTAIVAKADKLTAGNKADAKAARLAKAAKKAKAAAKAAKAAAKVAPATA
jgi:GTP-binding protein EngB required for normal cell division